MRNVIWKFKTKNFTVIVSAEEELDLDLSWDDTGEVAEKINSGEYAVFCAKCAVFFRGVEIATDYLGQCIYPDVSDFRDHIGRNAEGCGSYFSDMVRQAVCEARNALQDVPKVRACA